MTREFCDRCGTEAKNGRGRVQAQLATAPMHQLMVRVLCGRCYQQFLSWLKGANHGVTT